MKVIILAGGFGTRLAEETEVRPKPMVEIGGRPILWHIMKHYAHYGFKEFFIALGYKGDAIKRYFLDYYSLTGSMTINLSGGKIETHGRTCEDWTVHLIDTGLHSETGGRIKRVAPLMGDETFMLTYGDGVADVDINKLMAFHRSHRKLATVTAVHPRARFGELSLNGELVASFREKPEIDQGWINGGFFVLEPGVFNYIAGDTIHFESEPLEHLTKDGQFAAYRHEGFWQCMDTQRDVRLLQSLWESGKAPWKVWG